MVAGITDWILSLHGWVALAIVFLLPALEASAFVGFVFPGEIAVLLGGVLAYQGRIPLWAAIVAAVAGAAIGDSVGYAVGRRWGRQLLHGTIGRLPLIRRELDKHLGKAQDYVRRRGPHAILIGRFTAALRVLVPGLAGMSGVPYPSFLLFNVLGAVLWGAGFVLIGYFAGAAWERVAGDASKIGLGLLVLLLLGLVIARVLKRLRERGELVTDRLARAGPIRWARRMLPAQSAWLARRVDTTSPTGFALSLGVVSGVIAAWVFGALLQDVLAHEEAVRDDPGILRWVIHHRVSWLTGFMKTATWLGSNLVLIPAALAVAVVVARRRRSWRAMVQLAIAVVSADVLYNLVKAVTERPRPPLAFRLVHAGGFAFPSGHATEAAAVWATVALVLTAGTTLRSRALVWTAAVVIALLVAASRVYLGVHWFTDVAAGLALGAFAVSCIAAGDLLIQVRSRPRRPPVTSPPVSEEGDTGSLQRYTPL